ncbi:MAG TPA: UDP-N-acetylglucosamine 4,6-dehydratase (inverting) [Polyangia bacterium]|jgi:UDP-N-acetylglucosamine 4,6-dehydratase (inverting)|nr:UDP-N-acetylglucosamine 4,6-dehydratase (inverting) [Polyangia bacterium]
MLDNKSILITGGTGSFGQKLVRNILDRHDNCRVVVYSRDEMKQWNMANDFKDHPKSHLLRYFLGDVRDKDRLHRAFSGIDYVVHAAALKIVPAAEYNPFEFIKTNINGAMNVIDCAIEQNVRKVIALSTDKACNPINLYGATKLCSDKLFVAGNSYSGADSTRFAVVRYGNVMGSRGSVIPLFRSLRETGELPVTDERMTRFMITLEEGVSMVLHAMKDAVGGEIYVKKIPSMRLVDIAHAVAPQAKLKIIGIRPGEKLHEQMVSPEDSATTYEYRDYFKILPNIHNWKLDPNRIKDGKKCQAGFCYSSDLNGSWMPEADLRTWLHSEYGDDAPKGKGVASRTGQAWARKVAAGG